MQVKERVPLQALRVAMDSGRERTPGRVRIAIAVLHEGDSGIAMRRSFVTQSLLERSGSAILSVTVSIFQGVSSPLMVFRKLLVFVVNTCLPIRIITVDGGSPDGAGSLTEDFVTRENDGSFVWMLCLRRKFRLGVALHDSVRVSRVAWISTLRVDHSHGARHLGRMIRVAVGVDNEVVDGSRYVRAGRIEDQSLSPRVPRYAIVRQGVALRILRSPNSQSYKLLIETPVRREGQPKPAWMEISEFKGLSFLALTERHMPRTVSDYL